MSILGRIKASLEKTLLSVEKDLRHGLERIVKVSVDGAVGLVKDLFQLWGLFAIIIAVGFSALIMRAIVLWLAPSMSSHSKAWTEAFDVVCDVVEAIEVSVVDIILILKYLVEGFEKVFHIGKHHSNVHLKTVHPVRINATAFAEFWDHMVDDCAPYNTVESLAGPVFKRIVSPPICPLVRYLYPVPYLYVAADAVAGWATYDTRPWPHGNCIPTESEYISSECIALGSGYLILEILLPLILAVMIFIRLGPAVFYSILLTGQMIGVLITGILMILFSLVPS